MLASRHIAAVDGVVAAGEEGYVGVVERERRPGSGKQPLKEE